MQYEYPPPPGGPSPSAGPLSSPPETTGSGSAGVARVTHGRTDGQRSPYLPSITTQFLGHQTVPVSQASTPVSANHLSPHFSYNSPRSSAGLNTHVLTSSPPGAPARTPSMEPYNPQQWRSRGQVSGSQMVFQQRHATMLGGTVNTTGMEGELGAM